MGEVVTVKKQTIALHAAARRYKATKDKFKKVLPTLEAYGTAKVIKYHEDAMAAEQRLLNAAYAFAEVRS